MTVTIFWLLCITAMALSLHHPHEHEWEVEYLPDPMSGGGVVRSGDLFCRCGATTGDNEATCPECRQGKHNNCTQQLLDDNDEWVPCTCCTYGDGDAT